MEDKILIFQFKRGSRQALQRIYEKYRRYLLTLATAFLGDGHLAEDIVHDYFVAFAGNPDRLKLTGSLKWYLATGVANRARDTLRAKHRQSVELDQAETVAARDDGPDAALIGQEKWRHLCHALDQLPYEQRETVMLHTRGEMTFTAIAKLQHVSIKTVQSRYRYGLEKLRVTLNGQVEL